MTSCPLVTGVGPSRALSGTKITIRGENLGESQEDLIAVDICGINCIQWAEWVSSSKLICKTGSGSGVGSIRIVTLSGGEGQCNVTFTLESVDMLTESSVWVEEVLDDVDDETRHRTNSNELNPKDGDPLGIMCGQFYHTNKIAIRIMIFSTSLLELVCVILHI